MEHTRPVTCCRAAGTGDRQLRCVIEFLYGYFFWNFGDEEYGTGKV